MRVRSAPLEPVEVLVVDDRPQNLRATCFMLDSLEVRPLTALCGAEALERLRDHDVALVLLDARMPDMSGLELAARIKADERWCHVPIAFLTAGLDRESTRRAFALGAVDVLHKPVEPEALRAKVAVFADLHRMNRRIRDRDQLISSAAHELRTPLTVLHLQVQSIARALRRRAAVDRTDRCEAKIRIAEEQLVRLACLVEELLASGGVATGRLRLEPEVGAPTLDAR